MSAANTLAQLSESLERMRAATDRYDAGETRAANDIAKALCAVFDDRFGSVSLMTKLAMPDFAVLSTCPLPPKAASSASQALSVSEASGLVARPRLDEYLASARPVPWRYWWDDEPVYILDTGPVSRASLVAGAASWCDGYRLELPANQRGDLEFVALLVAGEEEEWPPSPTQLADVRQICHEVLSTPSMMKLVSG